LSPQAPDGIGTAFSHAYVRQALEMGIDQTGIIQSLFHGKGVVEDAPIASEPPTQFYDPALSKPLYPFSPSAGKKLLEDHGWTLSHGVMTKMGWLSALP
jgi:peptide/nickel transport system substrate-binding protein